MTHKGLETGELPVGEAKQQPHYHQDPIDAVRGDLGGSWCRSKNRKLGDILWGKFNLTPKVAIFKAL